MKFVILVVLLAFLIAFIVTVVKAAKNWRWYHITSAVICMLMAILLLFPTAAILKSRAAWHEVKEELEERVERVEDEQELILYGDASDPNSVGGFRSVSQQLEKIGTEAGRRWRNLQAQNNDPNAPITLRVPAEPPVPGQDAAAAPTEPLVPDGLVVYAFAEGSFPEQDKPVPVIYLGEFKVVSSQPTSVTVQATSELEPNQVRAISSGNARSWSLYELLPLDGHSPFIAEGSQPDDDNLLGRVDDQLVNLVLKNARPETREKYLRDGQRGTPEDPSARWVKIKFEKQYTIDVDSPEQRGALEGGFFDNNGRAVDGRLQRSDDGSITFAVGDELVVKEEAAQQLINQEQVASLVDNYYLRPLNDYRYILRRIRLQIKQLDTRIAEMEYEKQVLETALAATVDMLAKGQDEKLKLEQDLAQFQVETKAITQYFGEVKEELRQVREASSTLYRNNFELLRQIQRFSTASALTDT